MAAPKHAGGRPLKYKTAEELQSAIDKYFKSCLSPHKDKDGMLEFDANGEPILDQIKPFTMSGLAVALDVDRTTLVNYSYKDEFFDTIARARDICEQYAENRLFDRDGANGAKFALSNNYAGWSEKQDITSKNINLNKDVSEMSAEELQAELDKLGCKIQFDEAGSDTD